MNEVAKLYENAGLEPVLFFDCKSYNQKVEKGYLFTPEKQLELIKWMIKTNHRYFIQDIIADDFSETLAGVFNLYWQDLTEEERKQIKNILESEVRG